MNECEDCNRMDCRGRGCIGPIQPRQDKEKSFDDLFDDLVNRAKSKLTTDELSALIKSLNK